MSKGKTEVEVAVAAGVAAEVARELCRESETEMVARNCRWCRVISAEQTTGDVVSVEGAEVEEGDTV